MECDHRNEGINDIAMEYIASKGGGCSVFENPAFLDLFGGSVRPGGLAVTRRAIELSGLKKGDKVLDVGCGYGITVELLGKEYGIMAEGVDISKTLLDKGLERNPELKLAFGDGEMLDYPSRSFHGVFMECVLSLIENQGEAIHEAYCLLKKGGKLIISDFYLKKSGDWTKASEKTDENTKGGNCAGQAHNHGNHGNSLAKSCLDGAFAPQELETMLSETGFKILHKEDKNNELKGFTAALIMHFGSVDAFFKSARGESAEELCLHVNNNYKNAGYFLLIAEKM
ncbi:class I SAM-dependent methyltransferase [Bacillota bacterium]